MSEQSEGIFINGEKPSCEELEYKLDIVTKLASVPSANVEWGDNGKIFVWKDGELQLLGILPDLAESTKRYFGEDGVPEGVEYITFHGITFMTYKGRVFDCGDGRNLDKSLVKEVAYAANSVISSDIGTYVGTAADIVIDKKIYGTVSKGISAMELLFRTTSVNNIHDYDNALGQLTNLSHFDPTWIWGTGDINETYKNITGRAILQRVSYELQVQLAMGYDPVLECAKCKDDDVVIEWKEGARSGGLLNTGEDRWNVLPIEIDEEEIKKATKVQKRDPLIIDFTGNGIYSTTLEDGVHYDYGEDGWKEKSAWAEKGDGFLVYDRNGSGTIDEAGEFFGDRTLLADGSYAANGFEALAQYDQNRDNVINSEDEIFTKLSVWMDENGNGITDEGELKTLSELGIAAIGMEQNGQSYADENGNTVLAESTVSMEDGRKYSMGSLAFEVNTMDTKLEQEIEVPNHIAYYMPNLKGSGNVHSLHQAMALNPKLYELVNIYMGIEKAQDRNVIAEQILTMWAGCEDVQSGSRGYCVDATHLAVLEKFYGTDFYGVEESKNPNNTAGSILEGIYQKLLADVKDRLLLLTYGSYCYLYSPVLQDDENGQYICNLEDAIKITNSLYSDNQTVCEILKAYTTYVMGQGIDYSTLNTETVNCVLHELGFGSLDAVMENFVFRGGDSVMVEGTRMSDTIYAEARDVSIKGFGGDDTIYGGSGNDILDGEEGNDILYGEAGDDILYGGTGSDYLEGGTGSDTYFFEIGDGEDTVNNYDRDGWRNDRILFGEGISPEDIKMSRQGNSLVLENTESGDRVTVDNAFAYGNGERFIGKVEFADGTVWKPEDIKEMSRTFRGTEGNDSLRGFDNGYNYDLNENFYGEGGNDTIDAGGGDDRLYGGEGDDTLNGWDGDDFLHGGIGNDRLDGGNGRDTYFFELGDGEDTISSWDPENWRNDRILFGEGISPEDMKVSRQGNNLVFENTKSGDRVTVDSAFAYGNGGRFIGKVEFSDGTLWELEDIKELLRTLYGTEGNDSLRGFDNGYNYDLNETFYGEGGNDTIDAGGGDDRLYGGEGNDILNGWDGDDFLHGGKGNDRLDGGNGSDTYFFELGDGEDTINSWDPGNWRNDRILFGEGISPEDMKVSRQGNSLVFENTKSGDRVTVDSAFAYGNGGRFIGKVEFSDGTLWEPEDIKELLRTFRGTEGNDSLRGFDNGYNYDLNETFYGEDGNDTIDAGGGDDFLYGGEGDDILNGWDGDDFLHGGTGNDNLNGGKGNDTYFFELGDGKDTITDYDAAQDNSDTLCMNVEAEKLQFSRIGADLLVSILGTDDSVTIKNWYYGDAYHVENIQSSDGYSLAHTQIDQLIQAMASFEDASGMSWQEAVASEDDSVNQLVSQMWVKQGA